MANGRLIICVIGKNHSSRIRRIKFVLIRGKYSLRKFQMNSTVGRNSSQVHMVTWVGRGFHRGVIPRS